MGRQRQIPWPYWGIKEFFGGAREGVLCAHGKHTAQPQNITVEAELAQQTREARALANALRQAPGDARLQQELQGQP